MLAEFLTNLHEFATGPYGFWGGFGILIGMGYIFFPDVKEKFTKRKGVE